MNNPDVREHISSLYFRLKKAWDNQLTLIEFSYNNSYHSSIGMLSFEACTVKGAELLYAGNRLMRHSLLDLN